MQIIQNKNNLTVFFLAFITTSHKEMIERTVC